MNINDVFRTASGMEMGNLNSIFILLFFGTLFLIAAYIGKEQIAELRAGGSLGQISKTLIRVVILLIVCGVFLSS